MDTNANNTKSFATVKTYDFDLDIDPEHRWDKIIEDYIPLIQYIDENFNKIVPVPSSICSIVCWILQGIVRRGKTMYHKEMIGISKKTNVSLGRIALLQLLYEGSAACTSLITQTTKGLCLMRSMDWDLEILKSLTVQLKFKKDEKELFTASSWVGYTGILTGMKKNDYAISLNFRRTAEGSIMKNVKSLWSNYWPVGFLIRDILEDQENYQDALTRLKNSKLAAPCYFTICGVNEGCIITRNHESVDGFRCISLADKAKNWIAQTNVDNWLTEEEAKPVNILWSIERKKVLHQYFSFMERKQKTIDQKELWELFKINPIQNEETIYVTYMNPKTKCILTKIYG